MQADPQPAASRRSSASATATRSPRPITCRRFSSSARSASRASKARWSTASARRARRTSSCCPQGRGYPARRVRRPTMPQQAEATARAAHRAAEAARPMRPNARLYTPAEAQAVWKIRESGPRAAADGARRAAAMGRLGRCGGRAGEARRVPARAARAARRIRLPGGVLRPLRPRLHSHAGQLRPARAKPGIRKYGEFVERAADLVVQLRRLALRRARRRPVARRAAAEDVRRRADAGVPRVQGGLGSRTTR